MCPHICQAQVPILPQLLPFTTASGTFEHPYCRDVTFAYCTARRTSDVSDLDSKPAVRFPAPPHTSTGPTSDVPLPVGRATDANQVRVVASRATDHAGANRDYAPSSTTASSSICSMTTTSSIESCALTTTSSTTTVERPPSPSTTVAVSSTTTLPSVHASSTTSGSRPSFSERMSMRQPVRRAAKRAFWPSLPMASESC